MRLKFAQFSSPFTQLLSIFAVVVVLDVAAVDVAVDVADDVVVLDVVVAADDGHVTRPNLDTILLSSKQSK